jgi:hypothetical protein
MVTRQAVVVALIGFVFTTPAPTPAQGAPRSSSSPSSPEACAIEAFGHTVVITCGSNYLNCDWNGDRIRDEVFFVSPPNSYVYRVSRSSNGPVGVSNGKAQTMVRCEIRPTGARRVYAATTSGRVYYSQNTGGEWGDWHAYVP